MPTTVEPTSDELVIATSGLTKRFGSVVAVDGLDLEVRRGEVFGFLGPNGAGKTTTIRMLLDLVRPTSGRAVVLGGVGRDPAIRARIGYLPAELSLPPRYSARDVILFFSALRGSVDERHLAGLLHRFDLDPDRPVGELSTGNRRKVGLVQAFVHRPELLVLDEPTSGLDPLLQHEFNDLVRLSVRDGATVLLSSHVLPEVEALADRIGMLRRGQLVTTARPAELRRRARQRLVLTLAEDAAPVDLVETFRGVAGVVEVFLRDAMVVELSVEGPIRAALEVAATLDLDRISTPDEDDLEAAFLGFYREEGAPR